MSRILPNGVNNCTNSSLEQNTERSPRKRAYDDLLMWIKTDNRRESRSGFEHLRISTIMGDLLNCFLVTWSTAPLGPRWAAGGWCPRGKGQSGTARVCYWYHIQCLLINIRGGFSWSLSLNMLQEWILFKLLFSISRRKSRHTQQTNAAITPPDWTLLYFFCSWTLQLKEMDILSLCTT